MLFRTQYFIQISKRRVGEAEFDPDAVLTELFPDAGPNSGIEIAGDLLPMAVETRLQEIKKHVTTNSKSPVKIGPLEKAFPWTDFLAQTAKFAVARTQELEAQIAAQGGVDNIIECNEDKNFSALDPDTSNPSCHCESRSGTRHSNRPSADSRCISKETSRETQLVWTISDRRSFDTRHGPSQESSSCKSCSGCCQQDHRTKEERKEGTGDSAVTPNGC